MGDINFEEEIVLPGDDVTGRLAALGFSTLRLGAGLSQAVSGAIYCTLAGILCFLPPNRFYVLSNNRRYVPALGDTVVGVVKDRQSEHYRVRVNGISLALLPFLAFDGATRRNKPDLAPGSLIFARVASCSPHMDPELTCCAPPGAPKKDWVTGQGLFGSLQGGRLVHVSLGLSRRLLNPSCALLSQLSRSFPFEMAVGLNGMVWFVAGDDLLTNTVAEALESAEDLDEAECRALAQRLAKKVEKLKGRREGNED